MGINSVREMCARCPLVMTPELLGDLSQYKKARDKPVATAARALIALFREIAPGMLEKKDRGKGALSLSLSLSLSLFSLSESVRVCCLLCVVCVRARFCLLFFFVCLVNDEEKIRRRGFST